MSGNFTTLTPQSTFAYSYDVQLQHKRTLDSLKEEFEKRYSEHKKVEKEAKDFDILKTLGSGAFGTVFLVRDKLTSEYFAMKAVEKQKIVEKKNIRQILFERNILASVSFPFVINLVYSCKDNVYVYLILPYLNCASLYSQIKTFGALSEPLAQFYAAQVVLALEYLHHCCVIHRDVKPENILIEESGYAKLGDFGFAKLLRNRTWTLCGTPEYLAPEIIMSKGYSYSVDWWSLGVLIYEMNTGYPPFTNPNAMKLYDKILRCDYKSPSTMAVKCKQILKGLLELDCTKRLGSLKSGVFDIKYHKWFEDIDWRDLFNQKMEPPSIPTSILSTMENTDEDKDIRLKSKADSLYEEHFESF